MGNMGRIVQINASPGGVPKLPCEQGEVGPLGLVGDGHNDTAHHGGPMRALCLFSLERIEALQGEGHPISPGSTGENVTISGVDWGALVPGVRLGLGAVQVEVTGYASPCGTIAGSFVDGAFKRISHRLHPGWSRVCVRVVEPGTIRVGDVVRVL